MWANAQCNDRPPEYRWWPLFNAPVWLMPTTNETSEFIPPLWRPNSPHLCPLDYSICQVIRAESTKRRLTLLMSWCNELRGCAMRWNRLSISSAKDFKCVLKLVAVILNIRYDFVLAALSVFVDDKYIMHFISAELAKQQNCWLWATIVFTFNNNIVITNAEITYTVL